jgi:CheY-like chemotaxis protein
VRALVVDDEPDAAAMVRRILERARPWSRRRAPRTKRCKALESRSFDLLISDIGMPGRDGYELARELRAARARPAGHRADGVRAPRGQSKALQSGFQAHVPSRSRRWCSSRPSASLLRGQPRVESDA